MSCNGCSRKYGLFNRELGCPSCGFSYCSKCLKKSIQVPKLNNEKKKVCLLCYDKITKDALNFVNKKNEQDTLKMYENLDENLKNIQGPVTVYTTHLEDANIVDETIKSKLKSLQDNDEPIITQDNDIAKRLAQLKDTDFVESSSKPSLPDVDNRTDTEKANDLLKQYLEEEKISEKDSNDLDNIEKRLAALKDVPVEKVSDQKISLMEINTSSEDEDNTAQRILNKFMEEAALACGRARSPDDIQLLDDLPPPSQDTAELPFCAICNEDAMKRCEDCEGELYCDNCFDECHNDEDYKTHKSKPYKAPQTTEDDDSY